MSLLVEKGEEKERKRERKGRENGEEKERKGEERGEEKGEEKKRKREEVTIFVCK